MNLVDELKNLDVNDVGRWSLTFAFSVEPDTTSDSGVMTITVEKPRALFRRILFRSLT